MKHITHHNLRHRNRESEREWLITQYLFNIEKMVPMWYYAQIYRRHAKKPYTLKQLTKIATLLYRLNYHQKGLLSPSYEVMEQRHNCSWQRFDRPIHPGFPLDCKSLGVIWV